MKQNIEPAKIPNTSKYTRPSPEEVKRLKIPHKRHIGGKCFCVWICSILFLQHIYGFTDDPIPVVDDIRKHFVRQIASPFENLPS